MANAIENLEARSLAINKMESCSPIRFDILGDFGKMLNKRIEKSIKAIFSNYILVLDNFTVDEGNTEGIRNPKEDLIHRGFRERSR